jgi:hypothetical protein
MFMCHIIVTLREQADAIRVAVLALDLLLVVRCCVEATRVWASKCEVDVAGLSQYVSREGDFC